MQSEAQFQLETAVYGLCSLHLDGTHVDEYGELELTATVRRQKNGLMLIQPVVDVDMPDGTRETFILEVKARKAPAIVPGGWYRMELERAENTVGGTGRVFVSCRWRIVEGEWAQFAVADAVVTDMDSVKAADLYRVLGTTKEEFERNPGLFVGRELDICVNISRPRNEWPEMNRIIAFR